MKKLAGIVLTLVLCGVGTVFELKAQDGGSSGPRTLSRGRRVSKGDEPRRGIKGEFGESGRSAGRGGKGFGKNIAKGRVGRAGKEFGKGMGNFGKHLGKGIGKTMKRTFSKR